MGPSQKTRETSLKRFSSAKSGIIGTFNYDRVQDFCLLNNKTSQIRTGREEGRKSEEDPDIYLV